MSDWIGRTLSKVEIEKLLGKGGMAEVYLGQHTTLKRPVAVKVIHSHLAEDASATRRSRSQRCVIRISSRLWTTMLRKTTARTW
jgi:serine/threonine protein kinase